MCAGLSLAACNRTPEPEAVIPATPPPIAIQREAVQLSSSAPTATTPEPLYNEADAVILAKMVWGEARGCAADEQRLVVWTVLQRVDADEWDDTVAEVVTAECQFKGYNENHPVDADIYEICATALTEWYNGMQPPTHETYAPTVPYYFFEGDGEHNYFRENWR
jgi:hypothetical protein